ncbi:putative RNA methyltransferase [Marinomonas transparens]|uniref:Methyltransferase domain-containing protein n=1 Tax=Marinomonas transparens TaxID=2795388 RepID=A0A934N2J3_9GAMM|nr:methyltransferase domain-containing protein [Marinomonas transparens]MBJ7538822.1 methyltransferase domain-containing protein [Marinomonas transparens]
MSTFEHLSCPLDATPLSLNKRSLICARGHTYDLAKTGYINLLPVQNKRSKDPGDSKEMVAARQAFLNQQHYFPIVDQIVKSWPQDNMPSQARIRVLDAGCGEGYYLSQIGKAFSNQKGALERLGLDISKWAVTAASKRDKDVTWIVGSNASLPMPSDRVDVVLCLFGFPVFSEFARVLSKSGLLLLVESGADHLIELRKILYPSIHDYKPTHADGVPHFELVSESTANYSFTLPSQADIQQLLAMTPHIHKASYEGREAVKLLQSITLTADVKLRWYRKTTQETNHV